MEKDNADVRSETYQAEAKRWTKTSADPEAYSMGSWGMAKTAGEWRLFHILSSRAMREIDRCEDDGSNQPPFLWARKKLSIADERRESCSWDERTIGKRKPGEEGFNGGRPIPMQTIDAEKLKSDARRKRHGA